MLLKSLKLKNFRQFKGEQNITFASDKNRNVTVILGDNTSGKTTLVQAFNWGLYGTINFTTKDLLNVEVARKMGPGDKEPVEVEICLRHDDIDYIITRSQNYFHDNRSIRVQPVRLTVSYRQEDGQTETIREGLKESTINKILPPDLSSYFFFDGERINTISSKQDVTEAVKGLLGLSVLSNTMAHLNPNSKNSVIGKLDRSRDVGGNKKALEAQQRLDSIKNRREEISRVIANIKNEISYYEERKISIEDVLRENESTSNLQKRADNLTAHIKAEQKALEDAKKRIINEFNSNPVGFFAQPVMNKALILLKESEVEDKGIPNMNASSIDFLIKRGRCVCGVEIEEGNAVYNHLIKEKDFLPPQSIGTMIRNFNNQINMYGRASANFHSTIKARYEEIRRYRDRIQEWTDEVEEVSKQLIGKEDSAKYELELKDVKKRLRELNEKKRNFYVKMANV